MLFERKENVVEEPNYELLKEIEYKHKFGFLNELQNSVRTDEEFAKYKGYID